jgi:aspartate aminotransferase
MAQGLVGSEILKIAADIRAMPGGGADVCNLTVGDFSPTEFRIPRLLEDEIRAALERGETNYPPSDGVAELRRGVLAFYEERLGLRYPLESVLITGGSRPGIHGTYTTLVDPGDVVVYPVPSWNNNHYCHMAGAVQRAVVCDKETAFLPSRSHLEDAVRGARLLVLNSPSNPSGTAFTRDALEGICDLVLEENARRDGERPLFLLYDQVYWMLTFEGTAHVNPVSLRPDMRHYTLFIDGISKSFAATGVRVGWVVGPSDVVQRMAGIVGHIGAWAPRAEQTATARLLAAPDAIVEYSSRFKAEILERLGPLHEGLRRMRSEGLPVDTISPMGAIYLSARFNLIGKRAPDGTQLDTNEAIRRYLLREASLGIVPFQAFGSRNEDGWFRLSVGAVSPAAIHAMLPRLRAALERAA